MEDQKELQKELEAELAQATKLALEVEIKELGLKVKEVQEQSKQWNVNLIKVSGAYEYAQAKLLEITKNEKQGPIVS